MTAKELAAYVDRTGIAALPFGDGISIPVTVTDARRIFGRNELQVEPVGGSGRVWIHLVNFLPDPPKKKGARR